MTDLLPFSATPLERAVDGASARIDELDVPVRDLWDPGKCPLALLPWLAWGLGVETWEPDWPEAVKRQFCAEAFEVHRERGTAAAIRRVLSLIGAVYDYVEGPDGGLDPMTAKVSVLNSEAINLDGLDDVKAALDSVKRASVHLTVEFRTGFEGSLHLAAGFAALQAIDFGAAEGGPR